MQTTRTHSRRDVLQLTGTALATLATAGVASADHTHPVVDTEYPTNVTSSEATLQGELTDMGDGNSSVDVYFRWGENNYGYPNTTPVQTLTSTGSFSETIWPLDSETWYQYYAVAETDVTETGDAVIFKTEAGPSPEGATGEDA